LDERRHDKVGEYLGETMTEARLFDFAVPHGSHGECESRTVATEDTESATEDTETTESATEDTETTETRECARVRGRAKVRYGNAH
jgi:hypothetical protein